MNATDKKRASKPAAKRGCSRQNSLSRSQGPGSRAWMLLPDSNAAKSSAKAFPSW